MNVKIGKKVVKVENKYHVAIMSVLIILFIAGIIYSIAVMSLYNNNMHDYYHTHGEYNAYSSVTDVAYDEESQLVYVFYEDANAVNVYNRNGDFQWAVSIPRQANGLPQFCLDGEKMYLLWGDTYVYDAKSGEFIDAHASTDEEIAKADDFEKNYSLDGTGIDFSTNDVFVTDGGSKTYIVNKPGYYALINPFVGFSVSLICMIIVAILSAIEAKKTAKDREYDKAKCSKRIKGLVKWFKFLTAVNVIYAIANVILLMFTQISLMPYYIPIAVIFGISAVIYILVIRARKNEDEKHYLALWFVRSFAILIATFISVVLGAVLLG